MTEIVLASASPRREEICRLLGLAARVCPARRERAFDASLSPERNVLLTAREKAEEVASSLGREPPVLGADTVVVLDGRVLGKPRDERDARGMIAALQGRTHRVLTGVWVCGESRSDGYVESAEVSVCPMSEREIAEYAAGGEPLDKAGGYAVQGRFARYIEKICGDFYAVMGLPSCSLWRFLQSFES